MKDVGNGASLRAARQEGSAVRKCVRYASRWGRSLRSSSRYRDRRCGGRCVVVPPGRMSASTGAWSEEHGLTFPSVWGKVRACAGSAGWSSCTRMWSMKVWAPPLRYVGCAPSAFCAVRNRSECSSQRRRSSVLDQHARAAVCSTSMQLLCFTYLRGCPTSTWVCAHAAETLARARALSLSLALSLFLSLRERTNRSSRS